MKNKSYKDFEKTFIGDSDIASLILSGCSVIGKQEVDILKFGLDGNYNAYIVNDKMTFIPECYELRNIFKGWLKIYDDSSLTQSFYADEIYVYRAGEMGCIIQLVNKD